MNNKIKVTIEITYKIKANIFDVIKARILGKKAIGKIVRDIVSKIDYVLKDMEK